MKHILLALLGSITFICGYGQHAFYDALTLRRYLKENKISTANYKPDEQLKFEKSILEINNTSPENLTSVQVDSLKKMDSITNASLKIIKQSKIDSLNTILTYYFPDIDIINSDSATKQLQMNPFLKDLSIGGTETAELLPGLINSPSGIAGLNVTNIADGIAQFLIKRGKEELDAAFFNQMKNFLEKHEECKILFPSSVEFLSNIDPYKYSAFLQSLREAFHKDLSNLIIHLNKVIDLPKYQELNPGIRLAVRSANIVSELSQSGKSITPDSIISQLAALPWAAVNNNLGSSWKLLNIISQSVKETDTSKHHSWVQLSKLNQDLFDDPLTLRIYIGLLYQQVSMENLSFEFNGAGIRVDTFLYHNRNNIYKISGLIENFSLLANDVDQTITDFKSDSGKQTLTNDDYYTYISNAINIIDYGFKIANTIQDGVVGDKFILISRNATNLYKNIYTKNYNNAMMCAYNILDLLKINKDSLNTKILPGVLKYGNFMASVIKAESPEEVQNAIEATALPAGSYSIKQRSAWNLSLNGYIGYARDYQDGIFNGFFAQGIYAPVGVSVSHGSRTNGLAFSVFASLIDVGGIATYRLANGITDSLKQEIRLGNIFSPSAQLLIEKTKLPFALCFGWRLSPGLIYSKQNNFTTIPARSVFNAGVLIDIPLFTLWNKPFLSKK